MNHDPRRRRRFLKSALQAGSLGLTPGAITRALATPANRRTGTLQDVQHIVVLTQENRSFDHYFGALNGVRGFADPFPLPLPGGHTVWSQPRAAGKGQARPASPSRLLPFHLDTRAQPAHMRSAGTPHTWPDAQQAWDQGRMGDWPAAKGNQTMAHFAPADLPFQTALANAFTLCDAYHCAVQAGTLPNRHFLQSGTNDPLGTGNGPVIYNDIEGFGPARGPGSDTHYLWTTYAERLQAAGVSWQVYQDLDDNFDDNALSAYKTFRDAFHRRAGADDTLRQRAGSSGGLQRLRDDVQQGRLPQVSWVIGTAEGSEHPWKSSPAQGADYTAQVLDALTANPAVWSRTVLLINYDENDGFFDHMPPPAPPSLRGAGTAPQTAGMSSVSTVGEYHLRLAAGHTGDDERRWLGRPYGLGPRVPLFVVSPWSRGGWVCSEVFDHTSVIRLMEARFGVAEPNISPWRRAVCGDLSATLDFSTPTRQAAAPRMPATATAAAAARQFEDTPEAAVPAAQQPPAQPAGARPARAMPYDLHAQGQAAEGRVQLHLHNRGTAAAVVQVYDRLRLQDVPRRYTLGVGALASDHWPLAEDGRYDLWLVGPGGWHRHLQGRPAAPEPTAVLGLPAGPGRRVALRLALHNPLRSGLQLTLQAVSYVDTTPRLLTLRAGATRTWTLPLDTRHHWYDWVLRSPDGSAFVRRWAGHVETGRPSFTDPAMHGPAVLLAWDGGALRRPPPVLPSD